MQAIKIEKEKIRNVHPVHHEVLTAEHERRERQHLLHEAMLLGNNEHSKVKIVFETTEGIMEVETTVWAATAEDVELKNGIDIPVCCIREVIL